MKRIAVIMTVFNRSDKTIACLHSLFECTVQPESGVSFDVWLTDDGSTDNTATKLADEFSDRTINILKGDGNLFWNGGMIKAWSAAINHGGYDGYLWLNNDVLVLPDLWSELIAADEYSFRNYGMRGIYVGSLMDMKKEKLSYGGFNFVNKFTLKDEFLIPDGTFQNCQCAHGNITYVSDEVVDRMGIFYGGYVHGGTDHDYTYRAHKAGIPVFILRQYVGLCDNDHNSSRNILEGMSVRERIQFLQSPHGLNLHNTLLFQKRCFPWRYPFVWLTSYAKALFPKTIYSIRNIMSR